MADDRLAGDDIVFRRKRALYRAQHRGIKETDWMLGRFAEARLGAMAGDELARFEAFLERGDPELNAWLLDPACCPDGDFGELIEAIRAFNSLT